MSTDEDPAAWLQARVEADLARWCGLEAAYLPNIEREGEVLWMRARDHAAQFEAMLAILKEHGGEHFCFKRDGYGDGYDWFIGDCRVIHLLASGYKWWPGYRQEWKP